MPLLHLMVQQQLEHSVFPYLLLWECCHHAGETDAHSEIQVNTRKKKMLSFQCSVKAISTVVVANVALTTTVVEKTIL